VAIFSYWRTIHHAALLRSDPDDPSDPFLERDITGVMLSVADKPIRYQLLAAETGRWSRRHDLIVNYMGISRQ
jgi:hypothetical protein